MDLEKIIVLVFVVLTAVGIIYLKYHGRREKQEGVAQNPQQRSSGRAPSSKEA